MTAESILRLAESEGINFYLDENDTLRMKANPPPTPEVLATLKTHRLEILNYLTQVKHRHTKQDHSGVTVSSTARRALIVLERMYAQCEANLNAINKPITEALETRTRWKQKACEKLAIDWGVFDRVAGELINARLIHYDYHGVHVMLGRDTNQTGGANHDG